MKKIFLIVIALSVLGLAVFVHYIPRDNQVDTEDILPQSPLFYARARDLEKILSEFEKSRLGKNIRAIDIGALLEKSGVKSGEIAEQTKRVEKLFDQDSAKKLTAIFGKDAALAVYFAGPGQEIKAVVASRFTPEAQWMGLSALFSGKLKLKKGGEFKDYQGYPVFSAVIDKGLQIFYTKLDKYLVIATDEAILRECVDVSRAKRPALSSDKDFLSMKVQLPPEPRIFLYADVSVILRRIKNSLVAQECPRDKAGSAAYNPGDVLDMLSGFRKSGMAYVSSAKPWYKTVVTFDPGLLSPEFRRFYSYAPAMNDTLNFVPEDAIVYQWNNSFDLKALWDNFNKGLSGRSFDERAFVIDTVSALETSLGMSVDKDILPAVGNEAGIFLADFKMGPFFPVPESAFFVRIHDRAAAEKVISAVFQSRKLMVRPEDYNGMQIAVLSVPIGQLIQPAYCFTDRYFIFATSKRLLQDSLDSYQGKSPSLLSNPYFKSVDFGFTKDNNQVFFMRTDRFMDATEDILKWTLNVASLISSAKGAVDIGDYKNSGDPVPATENVTARLPDFVSREANATAVEDAALADAIDELAAVNQTEVQGTPVEEPSPQDNALVINALPDIGLLRFYFDTVVEPFIDGFKSSKAISARTVFRNNFIESYGYLNEED